MRLEKHQLGALAVRLHLATQLPPDRGPIWAGPDAAVGRSGRAATPTRPSRPMTRPSRRRGGHQPGDHLADRSRAETPTAKINAAKWRRRPPG